MLTTVSQRWREGRDSYRPAGAPEPRGDLRAWVERWLPQVTRRVRQAGTLKYVFPLAPAAKRAVGKGLPYVKLCDVGLCTETTPRHRPGCRREVTHAIQ